jgi:hypothetical protein
VKNTGGKLNGKIGKNPSPWKIPTAMTHWNTQWVAIPWHLVFGNPAKSLISGY